MQLLAALEQKKVTLNVEIFFVVIRNKLCPILHCPEDNLMN